MKKFILLTTLVLCTAGFNLLSHAENHTQMDKMVDFEALTKVYGEPKVQINLHSGLINLVAGLAAKDDPEAAALLSGIRGISVNIYDIGDNTELALKSIKSVSKQLQKLNWEPAVSVNEGEEQVRIFVNQHDGIIEGLLVLAAGKDSEAVFINIDGNIDPSKIAAITDSLNLDVNLGSEKSETN